METTGRTGRLVLECGDRTMATLSMADRRMFFALATVFVCIFGVAGCGARMNPDRQSSNSTATAEVRDSTPLAREPQGSMLTAMPDVATATVTAVTFELPTPGVATATSELELEASEIRICKDSPQRFSFRQELGIVQLATLRFESEQIITFEGWAPRPELIATPPVGEASPGEFPEAFASSRLQLRAGQLDLANGRLSSRPLAIEDAWANPCSQQCPLEVIGQSPDGLWQLMQVTDWLEEEMGIWLGSTEGATRIVPYVSSSPQWQWSADGTLLWLTYPDADYGAHAAIVWLDTPPIIQTTDYQDVLDPSLYFLAYSPLDNTVRSVPSFELGNSRVEEVITVRLTGDFGKVNAIQAMPGIISTNWNEATQSFVAQVVTGDGISFEELPEGKTLLIPNENLASLFPSFTDAHRSFPFGISAAGDSAMSKTGARLALIVSGELWVFECHSAR